MTTYSTGVIGRRYLAFEWGPFMDFYRVPITRSCVRCGVRGEAQLVVIESPLLKCSSCGHTWRARVRMAEINAFRAEQKKAVAEWRRQEASR